MPFRKLIIIFLAIATLTAVFYSNSLHNPFICDDEGLILKNPLIKNWNFFYKAFTNDLYQATMANSNFYRPLQIVLYMFDYHFWRFNPFGYHLTNVILQILVAFLVYLFTLFILKSSSISLLSALLFAVSPLHNEAVAYISGSAELLMGVFLLTSLLLFTRGRIGWSWFFFTAGLLSKELSIVFPIIILCWVIIYAKENLGKPRYLLKVIFPFLLIDAAYIFLRFSYLKFPTLFIPELTQYPLLLRISVLPQVFFAYLKLLILPVNLHLSRNLGYPTAFESIFISWFILIFLAVAVVIILAQSRRRDFKFLACWFFIFLLPQTGIFAINAFVAEHFLYLSSISFFIAVSFLLHRYLSKNLFLIVGSALILCYGILSFSQNYIWRSSVIFYEHILRFSPNSFLARNNLGVQYEMRGELFAAISQYQEAVKLKPERIEAHANLASIYSKMGKFDQAEKEYAIIQKLTPYNKAGELQNNIAAFYEKQGDLERALKYYNLALLLDPRLKSARFSAGRLYAQKGDPVKAQDLIFASLFGINQDKSQASFAVIQDVLKDNNSISCAFTFYHTLGLRFAQAGLFRQAVASFTNLVELAPEDSDAYFNLGLAYLKSGLKKEAKGALKEALTINPNHLKAKALLLAINCEK
jgi:protein O-mannosyl-transferase